MFFGLPVIAAKDKGKRLRRNDLYAKYARARRTGAYGSLKALPKLHVRGVESPYQSEWPADALNDI